MCWEALAVDVCSASSSKLSASRQHSRRCFIKLASLYVGTKYGRLVRHSSRRWLAALMAATHRPTFGYVFFIIQSDTVPFDRPVVTVSLALLLPFRNPSRSFPPKFCTITRGNCSLPWTLASTYSMNVCASKRRLSAPFLELGEGTTTHIPRKEVERRFICMISSRRAAIPVPQGPIGQINRDW